MFTVMTKLHSFYFYLISIFSLCTHDIPIKGYMLDLVVSASACQGLASPRLLGMQIVLGAKGLVSAPSPPFLSALVPAILYIRRLTFSQSPSVQS
jgi:hypothetical protein